MRKFFFNEILDHVSDESVAAVGHVSPCPKLGRRNSRPHVPKSKIEPRPTQLFHFEGKPSPKMLRITMDQGLHRKVEWAGLDTVIGPKFQQTKHLKPLKPQVSEPSLEVEAQTLETLALVCRGVLTCKNLHVGECRVPTNLSSCRCQAIRATMKEEVMVRCQRLAI